MSIRKTLFSVDEYYHVYNRGNSKQIIFHDKFDYERFIKLLFISNSKNNFVMRNIHKDIFYFERGSLLVGIGSYCLMPNHFHLLLKEREEGGLSKFMQKLATSYSMYYNKKYNRTGGLFEGKFKAEHLAKDKYLKYIFSYIHLNPLKLIDKNWKVCKVKNKEKFLDFLKRYTYSSYLDYMGNIRPENIIINYESFPNYFPRRESFEREIFEWLSFNDD